MHTWYSYDPERGYETWTTAAEAEKDADACLEHFRDKSSDGWHEDVASIEWGLLVPYGETKQVDRKEAPEGSGFDYICDYLLGSSPGDDPLEAAHRAIERLEQERDEARAEAARLLEVSLQSIRERDEAREAIKVALRFLESDLGGWWFSAPEGSDLAKARDTLRGLVASIHGAP